MIPPNRELILLKTLLILFTIFFFLAYLSQTRGVGLLGTGLDFSFENYTIMVLSLLSQVRIFYFIVKH